MDETRLFDPILSSLERTRQLGAWLREAHTIVLGDLELVDSATYERLHTLFLAAMGLLDFENDAAGDSPSLATGDDRPNLAPSLRERLG